MRDLLLHLESDPSESLQSKLQRRISDAILRGQLARGEALPSTRRLAKQLGIARNTVVLAYQLLAEQGFIESRERSGYYVAENYLGSIPTPPVASAVAGKMVDWPGRLARWPSRLRSIQKPENWRDYPYPFIYGQVDQELFPLAVWRECSRQALGRIAVGEWSADQLTADDPLLVEQIRTRVMPRRGVFADESEILITVGAQNALWILSSLLISEASKVGLEDPCYVDAHSIFSLRAGVTKSLALDHDGLMTGPQLRGLDYVYTTPSHQSPTTVTMPLKRREALLEQAAKDDFVLIEDDYEGEMNYTGQPTPALKSLDREDRVIHVGSLSKNLAPGLRIGYLVGPADMIAEARQLRRLILLHPPANNQHILALFLSQGHYDSLLNRIHKVYHRRWQLMQSALARYLPDSFQAPTFGGLSFWLEGPAGLDARLLAERALARGIVIEPGDVHFFIEPRPRQFFRLGFSAIADELIEPGIKLLAEVVDETLAETVKPSSRSKAG